MKGNVNCKMLLLFFSFQRLTLYKFINVYVIGHSESEIEQDERFDLMKTEDDITQPLILMNGMIESRKFIENKVSSNMI